jgi:hypothetical protein
MRFQNIEGVFRESLGRLVGLPGATQWIINGIPGSSLSGIIFRKEHQGNWNQDLKNCGGLRQGFPYSGYYPAQCEYKGGPFFLSGTCSKRFGGSMQSKKARRVAPHQMTPLLNERGEAAPSTNCMEELGKAIWIGKCEPPGTSSLRQ